MNSAVVYKAWKIVAYVGACMVAGASAQEVPGPVTGTTMLVPKQLNAAKADAAAKSDANTAQRADAAAPRSAGVDEILKMVQSGVSVEVTKAFIENSPVAYQLTAADVVALKAHAVPDEIVTAMIKRGAALRAEASQSSSPNSAVALPLDRTSGALDPESYEYFQHYYLYPRTLAAANQRLYCPPPGYSRSLPYPYAYYGPAPYGFFPPGWRP